LRKTAGLCGQEQAEHHRLLHGARQWALFEGQRGSGRVKGLRLLEGSDRHDVDPEVMAAGGFGVSSITSSAPESGCPISRSFKVLTIVTGCAGTETRARKGMD
jgi:hypothetical protein